MNSLLVTLVSEQTIPNILCVEYFKPDAILFITTEEMEKQNKIEPTMESMAYVFHENKYVQNNNVYTIKTREDSIVSVVRTLDCWVKDNESKYDKFIVNITLGTKFMSIGMFEALRYNQKTYKIVYLPLNENVIKLIPEWILKRNGKNTCFNNQDNSFEFSGITEEEEVEIPITRRLSILEYCKAYNVDISNFKYIEIYKERAVEDEVFVKWIIGGYFDDESCGDTIMKSILSEFFIKLQFYRNDKKQKDNLVKGAKIPINPVIVKKDGTENEIDVMFTSLNKIYMIECKSLQQEHDANSDIFYKIHSIQSKVGRLAAKSFLVSTATNNLLIKDKDIKKLQEMPFKDSVSKRAGELNTITIHPASIKNLKDELKKELS